VILRWFIVRIRRALKRAENQWSSAPLHPSSTWTCQVCEFRPAWRAFSSPFGAISFGYCEVCAGLGLEPVGFVESVAIELCGGWEKAGDEVRGYPAFALMQGLRSLES